MARSITVTLGGVSYDVPRLTVGQAEDLAELAVHPADKGFPLGTDGERLSGRPLITYTIGLAAVVLRRATPAIGDVRDLECDLADIQTAINAVLTSGGVSQDSAGNEAAGANPAT